MTAKKKNNIGSKFDDFLKEEGIFEAVDAAAIKRVIAMKIQDLMTEKRITKSALAKRMQTSRMAVDRLLDEHNKSITIKTLEKVANALGCQLKVELV